MRSELIAAVLVVAPMLALAGEPTTPQALQGEYAAQAGPGFTPSVERGRAFYAASHANKGKTQSCATCHGEDPRKPGKTNANKVVEPLAPAVHAARFTDRAKVEKWFRRNCSDVLGRECTAAERADLIAFLLSLGGK